MNAETGTDEDKKSGTVVEQCDLGRSARTHQKFWEPRLRQRTYVSDSGNRILIPEWQVRMQHAGRREWFNTHTANRAAAAVKARDIYLSLVSAGWEATHAKFKPNPIEKADVATVGEFLADVAKRSHIRPRTLHVYATKFRKLVADIAKVETGLKKKERRAKHDYHHGGRKEWLTKVEGKSLGILTPETIAAWRNAYRRLRLTLACSKSRWRASVSYSQRIVGIK